MTEDNHEGSDLDDSELEGVSGGYWTQVISICQAPPPGEVCM